MPHDVSTTEARRFTAIGLVHPSLGVGQADVRRSLGPSLKKLRELEVGADGWNTYQAEFERNTSLYPSHLIDAATRRRPSGSYGHDIFVAVRDHAALGTTMWIASPYMQLLDEMHAAAVERMPGPAPQYVAVDMKKLYTMLSEGMDRISAKRVILRIVAEENVELVSLTGKMPLHSEIHRGLLESTLPFGVGAQIDLGGRPCRVTVNRTGLVHWFQSERSTLTRPLFLLSRLASGGVLRSERLYPLTQEAKKADAALAE